jgi:hypothetical protein
MQNGLGKTLVAAEHQTNYLDEGQGKPLFLLHGSGPGVSACHQLGGCHARARP